MFSKFPRLKESLIFINEGLISKDQVELRKKVKKVKEVGKEGK
jgi:hypothetical protein